LDIGLSQFRGLLANWGAPVATLNLGEIATQRSGGGKLAFRFKPLSYMHLRYASGRVRQIATVLDEMGRIIVKKRLAVVYSRHDAITRLPAFRARGALPRGRNDNGSPVLRLAGGKGNAPWFAT
jgi:hypothetical protein